MSTSLEDGPDAVTYEALAELEHDFDDLDVQILRKQYYLSKGLYSRREQVISKIPGFWPLVLETAPPEIDRYIQPSDSEIFAKALTGIYVDRFELPQDNSAAGNDSIGDPRSVSIRFTFSANEWFDDKTLEKKFWWRRACDGWAGLVSEPVAIKWKKGKDPTKGLMDGAAALWAARKQAGDMTKRDLPEFDRMTKITETWNGDNTSFFTWFAFVSSRRWVGAEESMVATRADADRRARVRDGSAKATVQMPEDDQMESQVEAHEDGDGLATVIAEDLWPGAIKYFTQAQEDAEVSDDAFEEDSDEEDDGDTPDLGNDLRSIIAGPANGDDPDQRPRKKRRH